MNGQKSELTFKEKFHKFTQSRKVQRNFWGYAFIAPAIIAFIMFVLTPIIMSVVFSFTNFNGLSSSNMKFVGIANYKFIWNSSPIYWKSLGNIAIYVAIIVPVTLSLSMLLAVLIKKEIFGTKFFRGVFYLPGITSAVASAAVWSYLLSGNGVINNFIGEINGLLGTSLRPILLSNTSTAMTGLIMMAIWGGLGGNMILFLASMKGINPSIYEAAEIDGAGKTRSFFSITLPLMKHAIYFALTLSLIGAPQMFEPILMMDANTTTPVYEIYKNAVAGDQIGLGTAQSMILFVLIMVITFIMRAVNKDSEL